MAQDEIAQPESIRALRAERDQALARVAELERERGRLQYACDQLNGKPLPKCFTCSLELAWSSVFRCGDCKSIYCQRCLNVHFERESGHSKEKIIMDQAERIFTLEATLSQRDEQLRQAREEIAVMVEGSKLTSVHIGPLFNAGWAECVNYLAKQIRTLSAPSAAQPEM